MRYLFIFVCIPYRNYFLCNLHTIFKLFKLVTVFAVLVVVVKLFCFRKYSSRVNCKRTNGCTDETNNFSFLSCFFLWHNKKRCWNGSPFISPFLMLRDFVKNKNCIALFCHFFLSSLILEKLLRGNYIRK